MNKRKGMNMLRAWVDNREKSILDDGIDDELIKEVLYDMYQRGDLA